MTKKTLARGLFVGGVSLMLAAATSASGYGYGYHHGYGHSGVRVGYSSHGGGAIVLGVIAGVIIGHALLSHYRHPTYRHSKRHYGHNHRYEHDPYYDGTQHSHYQRSVHRQSSYKTTRTVRHQCQKTGKYRMLIRIDGELVDAWGTACLQADGTWRRLGLRVR